MVGKASKPEAGFTVLEGTFVVLLAGIVLALATPRIVEAMREYRLGIAARQMVDLLKRAKMEAVSEGRRSAVAVDLAGNRAGLVFYAGDGVTVERIQFVPLPEGVRFMRPATEAGPPPGVTGSGAISFPEKEGFYVQEINTRGFPVVPSGGDVVSIFLGNDESYRAITMTSVGGIRSYVLRDNQWTNTRAPHSGGGSSSSGS